jgi:hypothetical protein
VKEKEFPVTCPQKGYSLQQVNLMPEGQEGQATFAAVHLGKLVNTPKSLSFTHPTNIINPSLPSPVYCSGDLKNGKQVSVSRNSKSSRGTRRSSSILSHSHTSIP